MDDVGQFAISKASEWIRSERQRLHPRATQLDTQDAEHLARYFEPATLDVARVVLVDAVQDPPFYAELRQRGLANLPAFGDDVAVTFDDTIALVRPRVPSDERERQRLLVHELTHVEQYRRLGVDEFIRIYVGSWLRERRYERVILEMHAFSIDSNFRDSAAPFSVKQHLDILMKDLGKYY